MRRPLDLLGVLAAATVGAVLIVAAFGASLAFALPAILATGLVALVTGPREEA